jgi:hypothetical protein
MGETSVLYVARLADKLGENERIVPKSIPANKSP